MTDKQIIEETLEYYSKNNRALDNTGACVYLNQEGDMCAVGRCLINPENIGQGSIDILFDDEEELDRLLKPEYRGHSLKFWQKLQNFHDSDYNWVNGELTEKGKSNYNKLLTNYG